MPANSTELPAPVRDECDPIDVIYRVDSAGRVTFVNDGWNAFAARNNSPELIGEAILGRFIYDFIDGVETRSIYQHILRRAAAGAPITLPYRCDSPRVRRRMVLEVDARPPEIEFRSYVVESTVRLSIRLLDLQAPRSDAFLMICSWCNRGRIGERWLELEVVVEELGLFDGKVPQLTHGMCPDCLDQIMSTQGK